MSFADQIRDERARLGLTQAGTDAVLDTCRGQVAAWESGRNTPHVLTQEGARARLRTAIDHREAILAAYRELGLTIRPRIQKRSPVPSPQQQGRDHSPGSP